MDISIKSSNKYYFSHGRTALKYGLEFLKINSEDEILVPSYICDVALHPLIEKNIKIKFYELDDNFSPDWILLNNIITNKTKALIMVNYFGRAVFLEKYYEFCKTNNLKLIEDNCHGFNGFYKKKLLGTFGDIGFTSPRKFLNIKSGGILYTNNTNIEFGIKLDEYNDDNLYSQTKYKIRSKIKKNKFLSNIYKRIRKINRPPYENFDFFREDVIGDYKIGKNSKKIILNETSKSKNNNRLENYKFWHDFCNNSHELVPVFDEIQNDINPWCFPAYLKNSYQSSKWFDYGWKNNVTIFSWPTLPCNPSEEFKKNSRKKWMKLICFGTDSILK